MISILTGCAGGYYVGADYSTGYAGPAYYGGVWGPDVVVVDHDHDHDHHDYHDYSNRGYESRHSAGSFHDDHHR